MDSSNNNIANIQNELQTSISKPSVNEGNNVEHSVEYPAVLPPLKTVQTNPDEFSIVNKTGDVVGKVSSNIYSIAKKTANIASNVGEGIFDTGMALLNTGINVVKDAFSGVKNTSGDVVSGTYNVGKEIVDSSVNTGSNLVETVKDLGVNSVTSTVNTGKVLVNTAKNIGDNVVDTSSEIGNTIVSSLHNAANNVGKTVNDVSQNVESGVSDVFDHVKNTSASVRDELKGGVSVDLNNKSVKMLIPNNFLTSKHVYLVNYHENGTHLNDYKLDFKGGKVVNLNLQNTTDIWNNNTNMPVTSDSLNNTMKILNNLINDLSNSPQIGGFVRNRIADKDEYYKEYKNLKLKYLKLKNV